MSEVQLVEKTYKEPKEIGEIFAAIEGLIAVIKSEGSTAEKLAKATGELPKLVTAVDGYDKVKAETKHEAIYESSGAFVGRVVKAVAA